jgi:hypothetical protein
MRKPPEKKRPVRRKQQIVTFKVDDALQEAMEGIANRSEFIRSAVLAALDNACPLCKGLGVLSPKQRAHWDEFSGSHQIRECDDCHELYLVCAKRKK